MEKKKKSPSELIKYLLYNTAILLFGNGLYALVVQILIKPSGIVLGGMTGLSIMLNATVFPFIPVSYMTLFFNVILFILGTIVLGRHFAVTTAASTALYPLLLRVFEIVFPNGWSETNVILDDYILTVALSGFLFGVSVGVVVRTGASTGGSDIPPLVINKLTGFPIGTGMLILDGSIIAAQVFVSSDLKKVLYGILSVVVYSVVVDRVTVMGSGKVQISVMTEKVPEMRRAILTELGRGVTMLSATKGLSGEKTEMMMSVMSSRQLVRAKKIIQDVDPAAFMVITRVSEVSGNGFSFTKNDKKLDKDDVK